MKYLLLIQNFGIDKWESFSEDEKSAIYDEFQALAATPGVSRGFPLELPEAATTVRMDDGKTLTTDGPFVAVKEAIGGYFVFDGEDLEAAIEVAGRVPQVRRGGAVEVRPIREE